MCLAPLLTPLPIPTDALGRCHSRWSPTQISGSVPAPSTPPSACHFNPCSFVNFQV